MLRSTIAALAIVLTAGAATAQPVALKFAHGFNQNGTTANRFFKPWIAKIVAESKGTLTIELYGDGTLAKTGDTVDRVAAGVAEMGWDNPTQLGARMQSLSVSALPGLYEDAGIAAEALWKSYEKGVAGSELKNEKIKLLGFYVQPPVAYYFRKAPAKGDADFTGLKVGISAKVRADVTQGVGGIPLAISSADFYQTITKGVIDGVMTSLVAVIGQKIEDALDYYLIGAFGGSVNIFFINQAVYDKLPPDAKKAIDANSGLFASEWVSRDNQEFEDDTWKNKIISNPKNKVVRLDGAAKATWQKVFDKVVAEWVASTPDGQKIYDTFKADLAAVTASRKK